MRYLIALLLFLGLAFPSQAAPQTLQEARQRWLHGNYEEARSLYQGLAKDASQREAATVGVSRTWQSVGEYDKALEEVEEVLKDKPQSADLLARRAELLYLRGRWEEAEKDANGVLDVHPDHFLARWIRAQIYRDRGNLKSADAEFRWFVHTYSQRSDNDQDIKDPEELLVIGMAGCENARWHNLSDQFQFILNEVYGDALKFDQDFWPAEYQAGVLLLEKFNRGEALPAFQKALAINPRAAEALVGLGIAALQKFEVRDAEQFANRALKINPRLPEALELQADVHLAGGELDKAIHDLDQAREIKPRGETILGRLAACHFLDNKPNEFQKIIQEVEKVDPKAGLFYFQVAEELEGRRRFLEAEGFYKKATELRPMLPWPESSLGLLYMRLGREDEARAILTRAFEADPFNVRVSNTLKVLRHLENYATLKTPHFVLRYDPKRDKIQAQFVAQYLEQIYGDLTQKFQFQPRDPYLVELFNNQEMFSGRTIALPDLHTIGACSGRIMALVSPHGKDINQPFNWARVLRHETVHLFNLEQTNFQVPHWFTEGLAVLNEGYPRPQEWNKVLIKRASQGELMNLDNIELGFIRPRNHDDWTLAYCQARLYVEFLKEKYGPRIVGELLDAYKEGSSNESILKKVCKVDKDTFEKDYRAYVDGVVKTFEGKVPEKIREFDELKEHHEKEPEDLETTAQLALHYLERDQKTFALKLANEVLVKLPGQPLASYVKARLLQASGEEEEARKLLQTALDQGTPNLRILEMLGKMAYDAQDYRLAAKVYEQGRKQEPFEKRWLTELGRVYSQLNDKQKLASVLKDLVMNDADDIPDRKRLAKMALDVNQAAEGEKYARQALEIDVLDEDAQKTLGDALLMQKKIDSAIEVYLTVLEINDKEEGARVKLAQAYLENGQKDKARDELARVLGRNPENAEAKRLQEMADK